jgi:hypothetical protein
MFYEAPLKFYHKGLGCPLTLFFNFHRNLFANIIDDMLKALGTITTNEVQAWQSGPKK